MLLWFLKIYIKYKKKNIYIYILTGLVCSILFFFFFFLQIWNQDRNPRILNRGPIRPNPSENQIKLDFWSNLVDYFGLYGFLFFLFIIFFYNPK